MYNKEYYGKNKERINKRRREIRIRHIERSKRYYGCGTELAEPIQIMP